jgi:hypothetical protein
LSAVDPAFQSALCAAFGATVGTTIVPAHKSPDLPADRSADIAAVGATIIATVLPTE